MLADAIRAEGYRLTKNRTALLWSTLFVPVMSIVFGALGAFFLKSSQARIEVDSKMPPQVLEMLSSAPINVAQAMVDAAAKLDGPPLLLFVLIGAATLYAGDYRWETWRLISARNSRTNLLLGKLVVVGLLILAAQFLLLAGSLIEVLIRGPILARPLSFEATGQMVGQFFSVAAISWLGAIEFMMIGMLAAVLTRSLLAGLFVPIVVGVATALSPQLLAGAGIEPDSWLAVLVNPGSAIDALKAAVSHNPGAPPLPDGLLLKAVVSLTLWILAPLAGALALFRRQDLSKE